MSPERETPSPELHPPRRGSSGNRLLSYLLFLNVLNFIDRQLLVSLGFQIEEALGIGHAQVGLLYGYAFIVFYTFMGVILGTVADRWNRPRLIAIGLALWSLLTAASGAARTFAQMAAARMLVGVGEATLTPSALSMLSDALPASKRARAAGLYYAGTPLGFGISLLVTGLLAPIIGWRGCFYLLGSLGLVFVLPTLLMRDPRQASRVATSLETPETATAAPSTREILRLLGRALVRCPALSLTILGGCIALYFQNGMSFLIIWMQQERGFSLEQANFRMGLMVIFGGVGGSVLGGLLGDWWQRRTPGGRLYLVVVVFLLLGPAGMVYLTADPVTQPWLFYPPLALTMTISMMMFGPVFAAVQELAPARIRATSIGVSLFLFNVFGTGLGPFVTGWIGDRWSLTRGLLVSVIVGLFAVIPFFLAARRYAVDQARAEAL